MGDQQIEYEFEFECPDVAQFPCPKLEFNFGMTCCQITPILHCVGLVTGFASLFCGSRAEAPKEHMPKQR